MSDQEKRPPEADLFIGLSRIYGQVTASVGILGVLLHMASRDPDVRAYLMDMLGKARESMDGAVLDIGTSINVEAASTVSDLLDESTQNEAAEQMKIAAATIFDLFEKWVTEE